MKSKKILTILLSLAIMFTFMPAMAFATTPDTAYDSGKNVVWSDDYSTVTVEYSATDIVTYNTVRTFQTADGLIKAVATDADKSTSDKFSKRGITAPQGAYYDLDGAVLFKGSSEYTTRNFTYGDFTSEFKKDTPVTGWTLGVKAPSYVTNKTETAVVAATYLANAYAVGFNPEKVFDYDNEAAQSISVPVTLGFADAFKGKSFTPCWESHTSPYYFEAINSEKAVQSVTLNVAAKSTTPAQAGFRFVGMTSTSSPAPTVSGTSVTATALTYIGAPYTLEMKPADGLTVKYQILENGKFVDTSALTVTNVGDEVVGKAIVSKTGVADATFNVNLKVTTASSEKPVVSFSSDYDGYVDDPRTAGTKLPYFAVSEGYDPMDKLAVTPYIADGKNDPTATAKAIAAANEANLIAFVKDFYEFKKETKAAFPDYEFVKSVDKDLTSATKEEKTVLVGKYLQMLKNFDASYANTTATQAVTNWSDFCTALRKLGPTNLNGVAFTTNASTINPKDDDITFSGVTTKSFKAKKKTKKLAKAKSFQIAAVADSGNAITFTATTTNSKIKVSSTGKVTVKKGLKKGTYKVTVKAKTAAGNGYKACKESKTYTIKIK